MDRGERFLIAGAGGGFDFVQGIPLYLYITQTLKKEAVLANYSFSAVDETDCKIECFGTYEVTKDASALDYFPEKLVAGWLWDTYQINCPVYTFKYGTGVLPLRRAYNHLIEKYQIDTLLLVDGGTDSVIFGDEKGLGTIVEDANSMVAAAKTYAPYKYLAAIGFGIDHFHGVSHYNFLENVATLIKDNGYLGAFSLTQDMEEGRQFLALTDYLNKNNSERSIVNNSIASALEGDFGDIHRTDRTRENALFINPLMPLYWTFSLESIVNRMLFAPALEDCNTITEVINKIRKHKLLRENKHRHCQPIPL